MKQVTLIAILLCSFIWTSSAEGTLPLWKVEGKQNTLYLMGSLHLLKSSDYPLDSAFYDAFNSAEHIAFEVDLDKANTLSFQMYLLKESQLPAGQTLADVVTPEVYRKCSEAFNALGGSIQMVQRFKPFFAGMTLTILKMKRLGFDPLLGVDRHFHTLAKKEGKKVYGLETARSQIELLLSLDSQESNLLSSTVEEVENLEKDIVALSTFWRRGDAVGLDSLINASISEYPDLKERLLLQRNRNWMKSLEMLLGLKENVFVVVGAGHIGGHDGLLSLLKAKGYPVHQCSRFSGQ